MASSGTGSVPHLALELLNDAAKVNVLHVPYKGAAPAMNDLLAGQVNVKLDTIATSTPHIRSGRLKPLAIASLKRSPLMPNVPTLAESGAPGYQGILWLGILAPAATSAEHVKTLAEAIARMGRQPAFQKQLEAAGVDVVTSDPAAFAKQIHAELGQWAQVVKAAGIKAD
jgi:tripartite-type tricarboxylate transporter receptor subunit TctC